MPEFLDGTLQFDVTLVATITTAPAAAAQAGEMAGRVGRSRRRWPMVLLGTLHRNK
jgi:hypothetical protein